MAQTQRKAKKAVRTKGTSVEYRVVKNAPYGGKYVVVKSGKASGHLVKGKAKKSPAEINIQDPVEYASVLAHAVNTFGSRINASAWLNKPNRIFRNQTPLQVLTGDPAEVEEELVRIDHGMFL